MNDDLIQQWRDGDAMAATSVRNALRGIADAVLASPTGGASVAVADAGRRRELATAVAREVMQRGGTTPEELRGLGVMVAARHVVLVAREAGAGSAADSHLPPQLVVSLALAADSLSGHAREVADRHVADCSSCRQELDLVRRVVKGVTLPRPVPPASPGLASAAPAAATPAAAGPSAGGPSAAGPSGAGPSGAGAAPVTPAAASPAAATPADATAAALAPRPQARRPPATGGPVRPPRGGRLDGSGTVGWLEAMWPVLAILAVLVIMLALRTRDEQAQAAAPSIAALADRSPPPVPDPVTLPDDASSALVDLERGQCGLAAARLHTSRLRHPGDPAVAWMEGATWVCAGEGTRAQEALDAYLADGGASTPELLWFQAQAALLQGEPGVARERLVRLRPLADLELGSRIDEQLRALSTAGR